MDWENKNVLITGAAGFIGSHLTEHLVGLNANVSAFVKYNSRSDWGLLENSEVKDSVKIIAGDIKDSHAIRQATKGMDIIFHLAALIAIPYSYIHPRDYFDTNVTGTLNVLEAARENQVKKIVHTSTSEVYGTAKFVPITEKHPLHGQSPYSASKIGADKAAESFYNAFDLPVATIRPFNCYGPRQSARAIIPTIISQALYQKEIKLGSLTPTRDFTYVKDTVQGFIKIAESNQAVGQTINIGSNMEISIKELAELIIEQINPELKIISDKERIRPEKSEVERLWADNTKAKEMIDWLPGTDLEQGIKETIDYIKDNAALFKSNIYNR